MSIYDLILKRRTIRKFKQTSIKQEVLKKIVNAGRLAPSGANLQPLEYVIVDEKEKTNKLFPLVKWAGYIAPAGNPTEESRPVTYIVVLINTDIRANKGEVDAAAAIENMTLTALEEDIGSCWMGSIDREQIRELFQVPSNYEIDSVLALGYPDEIPVTEEFIDTIKYWKDEHGVLHVPKRNIDHIIHYNKFS